MNLPKGGSFYAALLWLLPLEFRHRHGAEMEAVFSDMLGDVRGPISWLLLHVGAVGDVLRLAWAERKRERRGWTMDELIQDLKYTARQLARKPGFSAVLIVTLALGVGANTAVFSVVHGVLLRPLPYPEPDNLAMVWTQFPTQDLMEFDASAPEFWEYQEQNRAFEILAGYDTDQINITGGDRPEKLEAAQVTGEFFEVLGVPALQGRVFSAEDDVPGAGTVAVISEGLWRRRFAAAPELIGQTLELDGTTFTLIGIMPASFVMPRADTDLWVTMNLDRADPHGRANHFLKMVGRLNPGVGLERAQLDLDGILSRWAQDESIGHTWSTENHPAFIRPLHEQIVGNVRQSLLVLLGAVGLVLLIACANVANLLLVRGEGRQREISIRTAMGAGRGRIVKLLITESAVMALLGGIVGIGFAILGLKGLLALAPDNLPRTQDIGLSGTVLGFSALVAVVSGFLFGLAPAFQAARLDIQAALREEGRGGTVSRQRFRLRQLLVISEMALAVVLLIGAGLLLQSFSRLNRVDPGFETEGILGLDVSLPDASYPEPSDVTGFYQRLMPRLAALPGVIVATGVQTAPLTGRLSPNDIAIENRMTVDEDPLLNADIQIVDHGYFRAMGVPILEGRAFNDSEHPSSEVVVVVDEVLVDRFFPGDNPIGRRIQLRGHEWARIVGVVGAVHQEGLDLDPRASLYLLHDQSPKTWFSVRSMTVLLRTDLDPLGLASAARTVVASMDPNLPVSRVTTMKANLADSTSTERFGMFLQLVFAVLALVLAVIGVYGVMSYSVAQRTQEIGIRMALGAKRESIMRLVVGQGMVLVLMAVVVGLLGALAAAQVISSLLYGISPRDPATYAAVTGILVLVALVACWLPARRASSVSPQTALRSE